MLTDNKPLCCVSRSQRLPLSIFAAVYYIGEAPVAAGLQQRTILLLFPHCLNESCLTTRLAVGLVANIEAGVDELLSAVVAGEARAVPVAAGSFDGLTREWLQETSAKRNSGEHY